MLGDLGSCPWRELPGGPAGSPEPWEKQRAWVWSTAPSELPAPPQHRAQQLSTARLESRSPGGTPPKSGLRAGAPGMGCGGTAQAPGGGETYPGRVHHALGRSGRAGRKHDEERVAEGQLLELQLGRLIPVPGRKEVIQKHTVGKHMGPNSDMPPRREVALVPLQSSQTRAWAGN